MPRASQLVYLDTMCWSRLATPTSEWPRDRVRGLIRALQAGVDMGSYGIVFGPAFADEVTRLRAHQPIVHQHILKLARTLSRERVMLTTNELIEREIAGRGPLPPQRRYYSTTLRKMFFKAMCDTTITAAAAAEVQGRVGDFLRQERERQFKVRDQMNGRSLVADMREWWKDRDQIIDDWVRRHLESVWSHLLPVDPTHWPTPGSLPTLRAWMAYKIARIYLNMGENRRVDEGDFYDAQHFAGAAYCDWLVTEDKRLRDTCAATGYAAPRAIGLAELEAMVLAKP
jgi:hypothetical protein